MKKPFINQHRLWAWIICCCGLISFFACFGCRSGLDSDDIQGSEPANLATIAGEVDVSQVLSSAVLPSAKVSPAYDFSGAIVFLEENPSLSARPDSAGRFAIHQVPRGSYHLIVRLSSPLASSFKVRLDTPLLVASADSPPSTRVVLNASDQADSHIRLLVVDSSGLPIPGTTVTLWGETFSYQGNGVYLSPPMPAKAVGTILIVPSPGSSLQAQSIVITAGTFVKAEIPSLGATLIPLGVIHRPPSVWIKPERFDVQGNEQLKVFGLATDSDGDELIPSWTASIGTFVDSGITQAIWQAPDITGTATLVFAVTEKTTRPLVFSSKAQVVISITGTNSPPPPPAPTPLTVGLQGTATTRISDSTVARFDALPSGGYPGSYTYSWSVTNGIMLSGQTSPSLLWRSPALSGTPDLSATISVSLTDGQQQAAASLTLSIVSSSTVPIAHEVPTADFSPAHGSIAFLNTPIPFHGFGTDSTSVAIPAASMTWFIDGILWAGKTGLNAFVATPGTLSPGNHLVRLEVTDSEGLIGSVTKRVFAGYPLPTIPSPPANSLYDNGSSIHFTGTPDSSGTLTMSWFRSDFAPSFGSGATTDATFVSRGRYAVTFVGTDSFGVGASDTVSVLIDTPPTMNLTPVNHAVFFGSSAITFNGSGLDSGTVPAAIPAASLTWYLDEALWAGKTGLNAFVANPGAGLHTVRLEGTDDLGISASVTHAITLGFPAASITLPLASGTRFDTGTTITFTATPAFVPNSATFSWLIDGIPCATNTTSYASNTIASGWHTITYSGTDSGAQVSSASIGIWVNSLPTITPILVSAPAPFSTGPAGEKIVTRIGGAGMDFSCSAIDQETGGNLPGTALNWFIAGDPATKAVGLTFNWLVSAPASLTIKCVAVDSWGFSVSTSTVIWAWDWEQYASHIVPGNSSFSANPGPLNFGSLLVNPTSIQAIDSTSLVVADIGNNRLLKVVRDNGGGLTTDGDLSGAAIDTVSPSPFTSGLIDVSYYSNQLFTLEKNAPVSLKTFDKTSFLVTSAFDYPIMGDNFTSPEGLARSAGVYFIADTGASLVRKADSGLGAFFSESATINSPGKVRTDGTWLYITDQAAGKLYKFPNDLNPMGAEWVNHAATSATDLVLAGTHVLISDAINHKVYVYNQSNGSYTYEFGSTAANPLQSPSGLAMVGNDLYIVERTNPGRITRIRSHGW